MNLANEINKITKTINVINKNNTKYGVMLINNNGTWEVSLVYKGHDLKLYQAISLSLKDPKTNDEAKEALNLLKKGILKDANNAINIYQKNIDNLKEAMGINDELSE